MYGGEIELKKTETMPLCSKKWKKAQRLSDLSHYKQIYSFHVLTFLPLSLQTKVDLNCIQAVNFHFLAVYVHQEWQKQIDSRRSRINTESCWPQRWNTHVVKISQDLICLKEKHSNHLYIKLNTINYTQLSTISQHKHVLKNYYI